MFRRGGRCRLGRRVVRVADSKLLGKVDCWYDWCLGSKKASPWRGRPRCLRSPTRPPRSPGELIEGRSRSGRSVADEGGAEGVRGGGAKLLLGRGKVSDRFGVV